VGCCSREQRLFTSVLYTILCTEKREIENPSKYRGFGVYSKNKTRDRMKMFITKKCVKSIEQLLSTFSSPFFGVKLLYD
jgi:hypothetical protein